MEKIKVILSCPQVIFREGIHFILSGEEDFEVAGETTSNLEALELIETNPPNIAILSQSDAKSDCAGVTRRIKGSYPAIAVVLITGKDAGEQLFPAIVSGISAGFTPDTDPENMLAIIRDVAHGRLPVIEALAAPSLAARTMADFQDLATLGERLGITMAQLSKKEADVLNALVSDGGIAPASDRLGISEDAVRNHLRAILFKLAANDRNREIIEKTQLTLHSFLPGPARTDSAATEYVTRAEFNEFKDSLMAGFRSLVGRKI